MIIYIYIYVCIWIRFILLETMISYIWLWTNWLWIDSNTQTNTGYSLVIWYPTNEGHLLVFWYPNQWGSFTGILIPKPIGVIHWYSDAQSRGYSVTIVIRLLRIWITFEYLKCFESLKLHMWYWKYLSIWTILSH